MEGRFGTNYTATKEFHFDVGAAEPILFQLASLATAPDGAAVIDVEASCRIYPGSNPPTTFKMDVYADSTLIWCGYLVDETTHVGRRVFFHPGGLPVNSGILVVMEQLNPVPAPGPQIFAGVITLRYDRSVSYRPGASHAIALP